MVSIVAGRLLAGSLSAIMLCSKTTSFLWEALGIIGNSPTPQEIVRHSGIAKSRLPRYENRADRCSPRAARSESISPTLKWPSAVKGGQLAYLLSQFAAPPAWTEDTSFVRPSKIAFLCSQKHSQLKAIGIGIRERMPSPHSMRAPTFQTASSRFTEFHRPPHSLACIIYSKTKVDRLHVTAMGLPEWSCCLTKEASRCAEILIAHFPRGPKRPWACGQQ
jgi:hypothetical protein